MSAIFVEVDCQDDFLIPGSSMDLDVQLEPLYNMETLSAVGKIIIGSVDSHEHDAWEFSTNDNVGPNGEDPKFPPHCVVGMDGWMRTFRHRSDKIQFIHPDAVSLNIKKGTDKVFLMKEVYSLFSNYHAENVLQWASHQLGGTKLAFVYGVASDYCVKEAAIGLEKRGYVTHIVYDAIWGTSKEAHEKAEAEMFDRGVRVISTKQALAINDAK